MHLIREELNSRLMPTCGLTDHDPVMGTTHDLACFGTESLILFLVFHQLGPHWSPINACSPFQVGLGPCVLR